jgi:hypothetical protein
MFLFNGLDEVLLKLKNVQKRNHWLYKLFSNKFITKYVKIVIFIFLLYSYKNNCLLSM